VTRHVGKLVLFPSGELKRIERIEVLGPLAVMAIRALSARATWILIEDAGHDP